MKKFAVYAHGARGKVTPKFRRKLTGFFQEATTAPRGERGSRPRGRSECVMDSRTDSMPRLVPPRVFRHAVRWLAPAILLSLPLSQVQAVVPSRPPDFESNPRTFTHR